ncbi:MAG: hypothetical protein ACP5IL_07975 [Syntrophobacteraceae bacterium]
MGDSIVSQLEIVRERFEKWRSIRANRREPIPDELWQAAAELCKAHPISNVCHRLRLSHPELKRHIAASAQSPQFMEIDVGCLTGSWQLECTRPDGARLRLSGSGRAPAAEAMLRDFLS